MQQNWIWPWQFETLTLIIFERCFSMRTCLVSTICTIIRVQIKKHGRFNTVRGQSTVNHGSWLLWFEPISAMHFSSTLFCHCWMSGIQLMKKSTTLLENYFLNFIRWTKYFITGLGTFFHVFLNSTVIHIKNCVSSSNMGLKSTQKIIRGTICSTVQPKSRFLDVPDQ